MSSVRRCAGVDASGALLALLLNPQSYHKGLQQAALALLLTKPLLPSITAASTRAVSLPLQAEFPA